MSKEISIDLPCWQAGAVVRQIGEKAGLELTVSGSVSYDWLMVRFRNRSTAQVLDEIAKTLDAEWHKVGTRLELTRPNRRVESASLMALPMVRAGLNELRPEPPALNAVTAEEMIARAIELSEPGRGSEFEAEEISRSAPHDRLLRRLAWIIGPEELSQLAPGERRTYSDAPTSWQYRISGAGGLAIKDYYLDLAIYMEAFNRLGGHGVEAKASAPAITKYQTLQGPPLQLMLVATRSANRLNLELLGLGRTGEYEPLTSHQISLALPKPEPEDPAANPLSRLTRPTTLPVEIQAAVSEGGVEYAISHLKERLATSLLHWGEAEALADLPTQFMQSALAEMDTDYIVVLPDSSLTAWPDLMRRTLPGGYAATHLLGGEVKQAESDGILRLRPLDMDAVRSRRLPRLVGQGVMASLKKEGRVTLDQAARLALHDRTNQVWTDLWSLAAFAFESDFELEPLMPNESAILRKYSQLAQGDKTAAEAADGLTRPLNEWPEDLRPLIIADGASLHPPGAEPSPLNRMQPKSLAADPSYILAGADLSQCRVTMLVRREDRIYQWDSSGDSGPPRPVDLEQFVLQMLDREDDRAQMPADRFAVAPVESLVVRFDFGMAGFVQHSFAIKSPPSGLQLLPYAQLPEAWKRRADERLKQARGALSGGATGLPLTIPPR